VAADLGDAGMGKGHNHPTVTRRHDGVHVLDSEMIGFDIGHLHAVIAPQLAPTMDSRIHRSIGRLGAIGARLDVAIGQQLPVLQNYALGAARTDIESHR